MTASHRRTVSDAKAALPDEAVEDVAGAVDASDDGGSADAYADLAASTIDKGDRSTRRADRTLLLPSFDDVVRLGRGTVFR